MGNFKPPDIEKLMNEADRNGDGEIDFREFIDWLMVPAAPLGAAALMSECNINIRARAPEGAADKPGSDEGIACWKFGGGGKPVPFTQIVSLECEHTLALWLKLGEDLCPEWGSLVGDDLWGLRVGVAPSGAFGIFDPRLGEGRELPPNEAQPRNKWMLVMLRGACSGPTASHNGKTEFLIASDLEGVQSQGWVDAVAGGRVLAEFGCIATSVAAIATVTVWQRTLLDEELHQLFLWDAVHFGCLTAEEADWLRKGRRWVPTRSEEEDAAMQQRVADAANGRCKGALDLSGLKLKDSDLPSVLDAVIASYEGVTALVLTDNFLTEDGVAEHIAPFLGGLRCPFRLDLKDNVDIAATAEAVLLDAAPLNLGCSVDMRGTQVTGRGLTALLNNNSDANEFRRAAILEMQKTAEACAAFDASQATVLQTWAAQVDDPVDLDKEEEDLLRDTWFQGEKEEEKAAAPAMPKFPEGKADKLKEVRTQLAETARKSYDHRGGESFPWSSPKRPPNCASGQILAHFSYLGYSLQLRPPEDFGMRLRERGSASTSVMSKEGAVSLHDAVERGQVRIDQASGHGYGQGSLRVSVVNATDASLVVEVPAGTIFEHIGWVHKQNLIVGRPLTLKLDPNDTRRVQIGGYCMNRTCGCASGEKMYLTSLLLDDPDVLESQGKVWDHFEDVFQRHREDAGFKKKKGKKTKGR